MREWAPLPDKELSRESHKVAYKKLQGGDPILIGASVSTSITEISRRSHDLEIYPCSLQLVCMSIKFILCHWKLMELVRFSLRGIEQDLNALYKAIVMIILLLFDV